MELHPLDVLLDLVGAFYDCAIEPQGWPAALERLAKLVGGATATISLHNSEAKRASMRIGWNVREKWVEAMNNTFPINPLACVNYYYDVDQPFTAFGFLGEDGWKNSRCYKEAVGAFQYSDGLMSLLAKSVSQFGCLTLVRNSDDPGYGSAEINILRLLAPHIRRAVMIADLLDSRALERDMLSTTLELLRVGIVLADASGRVVHANRAALAWLDHGSALRRFGDHLSARDPKSARDLKSAMAEAASGSTVAIPKPGIAVTIANHNGPDLVAWVLPLDRGLRQDLAATFTASVAIFIRELGDTSPFPAELFVRRYGITPAECRVLMLLTQGMTAREAAETLGVSQTTVKTHIGNLFGKTGTQRQADLVRLAMSAFAPAEM